MKKLLVIKCGATLSNLLQRKGDFEDWIVTGTGLDPEDVVIVNVEHDETLPDPETLAGAIITGSHAMVTERRPWSEQTAAWLKSAVGQVPLLGICYGHQLLGHALGGAVADNPLGREMGMVQVDFTPAAAADKLFNDLPTTITAPVSHQQSLRRLPEGAILLAHSAREPHQAFRYGETTWGVQFHPEFDAEVTAAYVDYCQSDLVAEGQDPDALRATCIDSPTGKTILRRFAELLPAC